MKNYKRSCPAASLATAMVLIGVCSPLKTDAQEYSLQAANTPRHEVVPFWPKPLPNNWVFGSLGSVCVDAQDHVFVANRGELYPRERMLATEAPPIVEFDPDGNVVNSWGDRKLLPKSLHGCFVDYQGNFWVGGARDGTIQKYTHDGSKMLLQIGSKGKFDSADETESRLTEVYAMNSSHELLNGPAGVAVDSTNGDIYVADGYGNRRVVVFDSGGHYLRQWGRQGRESEVDAGEGGVFMKVVHCVAIGNDGLVYVCDREGDRIEVFDKMGNFKRNIPFKMTKVAHRIPTEGEIVRGYTGGTIGTACSLGFSPDREQKFMIVGDCTDAEVRIVDRATGRDLARFGRPGYQPGNLLTAHSLAVDSKGNIYVAENMVLHRIQKFKLAK